MMKKTLSLGIVCLMLPAMAAWGRTFTAQELNFEVLSEGQRTCKIVSSTVQASSTISFLTIPASVSDPSTGTSYSVVEVGEGAFKGRKIYQLTIQASSDPLWFSHDAMASVELTGLTIARDFSSAANDEPFYGLSSLTSISLGNGMTRIPAFAFAKTAIKSVFIPATVESIGYGAFLNAYDLKTVSFAGASKLKSIGGEAFSVCGSLTNPGTLPEGLTSIGEMAYSNSSITSINLPASLKSIGRAAFTGCYEMSRIMVASGSPYSYSNGLLMSADRKIVYQGIDIDRSLTVPEGVTTIAGSAFWGSTISSVTLPSTLTTIEDHAFYSCRNMSFIKLPSGLKSIGEEAFAMCSNMTSFELPEGLRTIGKGCFIGMPIFSITIPASLTVIPEKAFELSKLKSIEIPETVTDIGALAFERCTLLESVTFGSTWTTVRNIAPAAFRGCTALTEVRFPQFLYSIGEEAFSGCTALTSISLPASLHHIDPRAFHAIPALSDISVSAPVPPRLTMDVFVNDVYRNATLKVPEGYASVYGTASVWELFSNITESAELSAIEDIRSDITNDGTVTVYRLDGVKIFEGPASEIPVLQSGIYLVNGNKVRF